MNWPLFFVAGLVYSIAKLLFYWGDNRASPDRKHAWERAGAGIAVVATFGLILSMSGWIGAAWNNIGAGIGLVILIVVTAAAVGWGGFAIIRGFKHNRHSTLAAGIIAGASIALVYGDFKAIWVNIGVYLGVARKGITSAPSTVHAATAHAATASHAAGHPASSAGLLGLILIGSAILALAWIAVSKHRGGDVRNVGAAAGARAIGAGKGSRGGGLPAGDLSPTFSGTRP